MVPIADEGSVGLALTAEKVQRWLNRSGKNLAITRRAIEGRRRGLRVVQFEVVDRSQQHASGGLLNKRSEVHMVPRAFQFQFFLPEVLRVTSEQSIRLNLQSVSFCFVECLHNDSVSGDICRRWHRCRIPGLSWPQSDFQRCVTPGPFDRVLKKSCNALSSYGCARKPGQKPYAEVWTSALQRVASHFLARRMISV